MAGACEDEMDDISDFVVEDEDTGSDDELQDLISSHHAKFVQDQHARHERIRTSRPWSAPPLMSPRPDQQKTKLAQAAELKARTSATEALLHQPRAAYEPPQIRHGTDMASMPASMSYLLPVRPQSAGHASWTQIPGCGGVPLQNILEDSPLDDHPSHGSHSHSSDSVNQQQDGVHDDSHALLNQELMPPCEDSTSCIEDSSIPIDDELYDQVGKSVSQVPSRRTTACDNDNAISASEVDEIPEDEEEEIPEDNEETETESTESSGTETEGEGEDIDEPEQNCTEPAAEQCQESDDKCGSDDDTVPNNKTTEEVDATKQSDKFADSSQEGPAALISTLGLVAESASGKTTSPPKCTSTPAVRSTSAESLASPDSCVWQQAVSVGRAQPVIAASTTTPVVRVPTSLIAAMEINHGEKLLVRSRHTDVKEGISTGLQSNLSEGKSSVDEEPEEASKRSSLTDYGVLLHPHAFAEQLLKHDLGADVLHGPVQDCTLVQDTEHQDYEQGDICNAGGQSEEPCSTNQLMVNQAIMPPSDAIMQAGHELDVPGQDTRKAYAEIITYSTEQQQQQSRRPPRPKSAGFNFGNAYKNQTRTQMLDGFDSSRRARKTQALARETMRVIADARHAVGRPMSAPSSRSTNKPTHASFVNHGFESGYGPSRTSYNNMGWNMKGTGTESNSLHRSRGHAQAWQVPGKHQDVVQGTALASDDEAEVQDLLADAEEVTPANTNTTAQRPGASLYATQRQTYSPPAAKPGKTARPSTAPCHGRQAAALPAGQELPWWIESPYLPASSTLAIKPGQLVGGARTLYMPSGKRQAALPRSRPASAHPLGKPATLLTATCEPGQFNCNSTTIAHQTSSCSTAAVDVAGTQVSVYVAEIMRKVTEANRWLNQLGFQHRYRLKKPTRNLEVQMYDSKWKPAPYTAIGQRYGVAALSADELMSLAPTTKKLSLSQFLAAHAKLCMQQPSQSICFHKNPSVVTMYAKQAEMLNVIEGKGGAGQAAQVLQVEHVQQQLEAALYACDAALSASP